MKVMTIVGTRPELIKMCRVIEEFDRHTNHVLVHTGQNYDYELNQIFFEDLGIRKPDYFLNAAGKNASQTIAKVIERSDEILERECPQAILLYGDTNSCLSVIAAKRRKIPVFHMEAGNRCFDERVPEELNRKVVDHLSDINMVLTEHARRYLMAEGKRPETIFKTGSHMQEVLTHYRGKIDDSSILNKLRLEADRYLLVSLHREENVDAPESLRLIVETLDHLSQVFDMPIVVSTHPRTRKRLDEMPDIKLPETVQFLKPFGFFDYIKLQTKAFCVISDSGTITEESSLLGFPAVTIREMHERPEGFDAGTLIMSGLGKDSTEKAIKVIRSQKFDQANPDHRFADQFGRVEDYESSFPSRQILRIVLSYTDYVNRVVWRKN